MPKRDLLTAAAILSAAAFVLLNMAWAFGNPPGAAPDENAHFIKAYATADGQFDGKPFGAPLLAGLDARRASWLTVSGRSFQMPARLVPPASGSCYAVNPDLTPDCLDFRLAADPNAEVLAHTHLATYNPFPYLALGLVMRGASDFQSATRRGRLVSLVICTMFVSWAVALGRRRGPFTLIGIVLAGTPAVIFLAGSLNTSGMEIASAICLWSALLVLARQPDQRAAWAWGAVAVAGIALALIRPLGAVLLPVVVGTVIVLVGPAPLWGGVRRSKLAQGSVAIVSLACALSFLWGHFATAHPSVDFNVAIQSLGATLRDLPNQARDVIGIFGWNDTTMPMPAYILGLVLLGGLGLLALALGSFRERLALAGLGVAILVLHLGLALFVEAQIGYGMQARYLMPLVVGLAIAAADIVQGHVDQLRQKTVRLLLAAGYCGAAVLQLAAFVANEHRYAVGLHGSWLLPWDSRWSPDGGLLIWLIVVGAACMALAAAAVVVTRPASSWPS